MTQELTALTQTFLPALFAPDKHAGRRSIEFFTANIRNPNTRKAYAPAASEFGVRLNKRHESPTGFPANP